MNRSQPFARAKAMLAAISLIVSQFHGIEQQTKLNELGPYVSRGKGKGKASRARPGAGMAAIRAARKARNVRRHRAACRG